VRDAGRHALGSFRGPSRSEAGQSAFGRSLSVVMEGSYFVLLCGHCRLVAFVRARRLEGMRLSRLCGREAAGLDGIASLQLLLVVR